MLFNNCSRHVSTHSAIPNQSSSVMSQIHSRIMTLLLSLCPLHYAPPSSQHLQLQTQTQPAKPTPVQQTQQYFDLEVAATVRVDLVGRRERMIHIYVSLSLCRSPGGASPSEKNASAEDRTTPTTKPRSEHRHAKKLYRVSTIMAWRFWTPTHTALHSRDQRDHRRKGTVFCMNAASAP
jgi:hypothetical protein